MQADGRNILRWPLLAALVLIWPFMARSQAVIEGRVLLPSPEILVGTAPALCGPGG